MEIIKQEGNWLQVKAGSQTGWVSSDHVKTSGQESTIKSGTTTARVNLRTGAGTNNRILTTLNIGQKFEIIKEQNGWYQVAVGSQTGWVSAEYVQIGNAQQKIQVMARTFSMSFEEPVEEAKSEPSTDVTIEADVIEEETESISDDAVEVTISELSSDETVESDVVEDELEAPSDETVEETTSEPSTDETAEVDVVEDQLEASSDEAVEETTSDSSSDETVETDAVEDQLDAPSDEAVEETTSDSSTDETAEVDVVEDELEAPSNEAAEETSSEPSSDENVEADVVKEEVDIPAEVETDSDEITLDSHAILNEKTFLLSTPTQGDLTEIELETGDEVKIIEQTGDFALVEFEDKQGWIMVKSLAI
ncbi:uncharacterized protein YgiM (DUF1202 family) [Alkalihalobacillus xiaoxiensis]|uniref:Uncharacterized protein YgiM (DUF1202 family) n=1 Tax=Shouchella xiaoxiensis TaxID=766895 RepID=A0ABS2T073_9BACI|nr:uncharacterized protein YgiM (DUF1202 family) [Shouchella xiaoxiensis]